MSRQNPNILISGTPGVGKSTLASMIADKSNLSWMNIGDFAKVNSRANSYVNELRLSKKIEGKMKEG